MVNALELEARISALELVVLTHVLQSGLADAAFDPRAFAIARRDAWTAIGQAMCDDCPPGDEDSAFTLAYANALERLGHLLTALADPVEEAINEVSEGYPYRQPG